MAVSATLSILALYRYDSTLFDGLQLPEGVDKDTLVDNILLDAASLEVLYPDPVFMNRAINVWSKKRLPVWTELQKTLEYEYNPIDNYDRTETVTEGTERTGSGTSSRSGSNTGSATGKSTSENSSTSSSTTETENSSTTTSTVTTENTSTVNGTDSTESSSNSSGTNTGTTSNTAYNSDAFADTSKTVTSGSSTGSDESTTTKASTTSDEGSSSTTTTVSGTGSSSTTSKASDSNTSTSTSSSTETITETGETETSLFEQRSMTTRTHGNIGVTTTQQMITAQREVVSFSLLDVIEDEFIAKFCLAVY